MECRSFEHEWLEGLWSMSEQCFLSLSINPPHPTPVSKGKIIHGLITYDPLKIDHTFLALHFH